MQYEKTQDNMDLFRAILAAGGCKCAYGANMSSDKDYTDEYGWFGEKGKVYTSKELNKIWKDIKSKKFVLEFESIEQVEKIFEEARESGLFFDNKAARERDIKN